MKRRCITLVSRELSPALLAHCSRAFEVSKVEFNGGGKKRSYLKLTSVTAMKGERS
jgi:hypothetical protein